jgi:hypothetical protein
MIIFTETFAPLIYHALEFIITFFKRAIQLEAFNHNCNNTNLPTLNNFVYVCMYLDNLKHKLNTLFFE